MDKVACDNVRAAGRTGEVNACYVNRCRGRCVGERMHGVVRHGLARRRGSGGDAIHRLQGTAVRVQARSGKVADGVAGDGVDPG